MPHIFKRKLKRRVRRKKSSKRSNLPRKLDVLSKRVGRLSKMMDSMDGELIYRDINYQTGVCAQNIRAYIGGSFQTVGSMREGLAQLRYYDIDTPGTLKVVDLDDSAFQIDAHIVRSSISLTVRTNYLVPIIYTVWWCPVKTDTSYNPITLMQTLDDDFMNTSYVDADIFPSDFDGMKEFFGFQKLASGILMGGQEKTWTHHMKGTVTYNTSVVDAHNDSYQKKFGSGHILMRYGGVLAHDSVTPTAVGLAPVSIDAIVKKFMTIKYNAGADIKYIYVNSDESAFAVVPQITQRPITAQQASTA